MKLIDLKEGKMKRSDPWISGDRDGPRPDPKAVPAKYDTKILNLAKKAGVSPEKVEAVWKRVKGEVDLKLPNAYAVVMARVQRELGLREELLEDKEFKDDENGSLVYGWKDVEELNDEEDIGRGPPYIPKGYKKVLELGGIYANEPGKGQGDKLMKQFLASKEAKAADLIFLDPVPNLGKNYGTGKSEDEQVASLVKFYKRYGFRHNPKSAVKRMWLVKKGELSDTQLPT